ncbi:MAG TPA: GNAT family N-acetyltransferase [Vicinamibacterales bacterium]|nr:GNAT family N-acetyltransferase [Vicinamibacterales bacterium]
MATSTRGPEGTLKLRPMTIDDFDALIALQARCFPGMGPWARAQIENQLRIFPDGQMVLDLDGRIVASSSSLIVDSSGHSEWHDWKVITDNGYIRSHDPHGDMLYGIEIMVDPEFRGMKLARRLYDARRQLVRDRNLRGIIIGGRLPGYGEHADKMAASEYVERVISKELLDPVLTPQLSNGFVLKGLIPNYFPSDVASRGYATYLEWTNLDYVALDSRQLMRRSSPVRLSAVQYQLRRIASFDDFAKQCEFFVDVASDYTSDFLLFPELLTTQLLSTITADRPGRSARMLAELTPRYVELFRGLAVKYHLNIIAGSQFELDGDRLYNTAFLFRRDGSMERQRKLHITPHERKWWGVAPGTELTTFDTDRGRIAILIGYDVQFPELARVAFAQGARMLFVPFNSDERNDYLRVRYCAQARCVENPVFVVLSGCVGNLPEVEHADIHYAQSAIMAPSDFYFSRDGVAAECQPNVETVIFADVDLQMLRRQRYKGTTMNWEDRRRDLYSIHYAPPSTPPEPI